MQNSSLHNQDTSQSLTYNPYFYMNSQYPFGASDNMGGLNLGMNVMGFNFDSMRGMNSINQMNISNNIENFNQKK